MNTRSTSIFKEMLLNTCLFSMTNVIVFVDKALINIVFGCKSHYITLRNQALAIYFVTLQKMYTPTTLTKEEILDNHMFVICCFEIPPNMKTWIYRHYLIPKLHKCPYKPGSTTCSTKLLSNLLICLLSAVNTGLQSYCDTSYSRNRVNQMWRLENFKKICQRTYNLGPSPPAIALKHLNNNLPE